jgi:Arc/MetJ family transcription regulator
MTTIQVDKHLLETGLKLTGLTSHRELAEHALRELIRREQQKKLLNLKGRIDYYR